MELSEWLEKLDAKAVLVRPDRFLFGTAKDRGRGRGADDSARGAALPGRLSRAALPSHVAGDQDAMVVA